ncbi:uncharacterized protein LOC132728539 [Ruditapes philippinarum]|uniref:uncharacterized protein LOC132728539 n=1 Tax=Ruditapes philippinarum TaxID=129788 RepID=UPI00295C1714|nr:uncharacterized protein LOC132728539 [Ruditapes philippinarum]
MLQTTLVFGVAYCLFYMQHVEASCGFYGGVGIRPGERPITTCKYRGWEISINSTFRSPAPYCEECTCGDGGGMACCGYGWKAGPIGIQGCVRIIDYSTCDSLFFDENDTSRPCPGMPRIPASSISFP